MNNIYHLAPSVPAAADTFSFFLGEKWCDYFGPYKAAGMTGGGAVRMHQQIRDSENGTGPKSLLALHR